MSAIIKSPKTLQQKGERRRFLEMILSMLFLLQGTGVRELPGVLEAYIYNIIPTPAHVFQVLKAP
jgi:hypothetical protein